MFAKTEPMSISPEAESMSTPPRVKKRKQYPLEVKGRGKLLKSDEIPVAAEKALIPDAQSLRQQVSALQDLIHQLVVHKQRLGANLKKMTELQPSIDKAKQLQPKSLTFPQEYVREVQKAGIQVNKIKEIQREIDKITALAGSAISFSEEEYRSTFEGFQTKAQAMMDNAEINGMIRDYESAAQALAEQAVKNTDLSAFLTPPGTRTRRKRTSYDGRPNFFGLSLTEIFTLKPFYRQEREQQAKGAGAKELKTAYRNDLSDHDHDSDPGSPLEEKQTTPLFLKDCGEKLNKFIGQLEGFLPVLESAVSKLFDAERAFAHAKWASKDIASSCAALLDQFALALIKAGEYTSLVKNLDEVLSTIEKCKDFPKEGSELTKVQVAISNIRSKKDDLCYEMDNLVTDISTCLIDFQPVFFDTSFSLEDVYDVSLPHRRNIIFCFEKWLDLGEPDEGLWSFVHAKLTKKNESDESRYSFQASSVEGFSSPR